MKPRKHILRLEKHVAQTRETIVGMINEGHIRDADVPFDEWERASNKLINEAERHLLIKGE